MKKLSLLVLKLFFVSALLNGQITQLDLIKLSNTHIITELRDSMWLYGELLADTWEQSVWKSADGKKWELVKDGVPEIHFNSAGVAFKGKLYSIGGHVGSSASNIVSVSENGKDWTTYNAPFIGREKLGCVVHNDKLFVLAGAGLNDVWYTENGTDWIQATNKISDDFPHFWRPRVVSLNNKLILFGGSKTDWGFVKNERGVYISEDDGKNWIRHECPINGINLGGPMYFVYNDKLWVVVNNSPNKNFGNQYYFPVDYKIFVTSDGIDWREYANGNLPIIENRDIISKAYCFKGKVHSYAKRGGGGNLPVFHAEFTESEIYLDNITSDIKLVSDPATYTIPFTYKHTDPANTNPITFSVSSSDNSVIPCGSIKVNSNNISVTKTGKVGISEIEITATDGVSTNAVQFHIAVYPDEKVYLSGKNSNIMKKNGDVKNAFFKYNTLSGYGANSFTVSCSDNLFIIPAEVSINEHPVLKGFYYISLGSSFTTSKEGEAILTVTATDGVNSQSRDIYVKVGDNSAPVLSNNPDNYVINQGDAFNYMLPAGLFTDPENDNIIYSSDNLPCGLTINENTGAITGITDELLPYNINITATDRYGLETTTVLNVVTPGGNTNSAPDNITLTKSSVSENVPVGTEVAVISATDPDSGDVITYSLDNTSVFKIDNNRLLTNAELNFELKSSYTVKITATDNNSASTIKAFNINVTDVNESPANINITNREVDDNVAVGFEV
ncbi:MAG: putative Ig domain-containing protein, partial [Bacteroidales bacterium]|nr:putative Ig domain-containing protein [Bacteroidales bacterium]